MSVVSAFTAREILDSRGAPTLEATCLLASGASGTASVPSGKSTGRFEAVELRDRDPRRYRGLGCRLAVSNVEGTIAPFLHGRDLPDQEGCDSLLVELDGTVNKSHLGANSLLAVSLAFARAQAAEKGSPLYRHFSAVAGIEPAGLLPRLTINLFSGGRHAGRQVEVQDVLVVPLAPLSVDASLVMMYDIYQAAAELAFDRYGMRLLTADEGGLAPPFDNAEAMLATAVEAIERAGYRPGTEAALAVDLAATHFYVGGRYRIDGRELSSEGMVRLLESWLERFPLISIEDGLAEEDWRGWELLQAELGKRCLLLGDDLLCTNPERIQIAVDRQACNALLLKVNQIGTLTEAAAAMRLARTAGWQISVSVRSGETEDSWAADLATGWQGNQFKNGSITQSERLAKYNRLLAIEHETGWRVRSWGS